MKKYIAVSQGVPIAEFKDAVEAWAFVDIANDSYYNYVQECIDNGEEIANNETF